MSTLSPHSSLSDLLKASQQQGTTKKNNITREEGSASCPSYPAAGIPSESRGNHNSPGIATATSNVATAPATADAVDVDAVARIVNSPNRPSQRMHRRRTTGDVSQEERNRYYSNLQLQQSASGPMSSPPITVISRVYSYEPLEQRQSANHHHHPHYQYQSQSQPHPLQQQSYLSTHQPFRDNNNRTMENLNQDGVHVAEETGRTVAVAVQSSLSSLSPTPPSTSCTTSHHHHHHHHHPYAQYDPLFNHGGNHSNHNKIDTAILDNVVLQDDDCPMNKKNHRQSITLDTASLAEIAAQLSTLKPQKQQQQQQQRQQQELDHSLQINSNHLITLGMEPSESTGTKKSHRRFKSQPFGRKSMNMVDSSVLSMDIFNSTNNEIDKKVEKDVQQGHRRSFSAGLAAVFRREEDGEKNDRQRSVTPVGFRSSREKKVGSGSHKKGRDDHDDDVGVVVVGGGGDGCKDRPTTPVEKGKGGGGGVHVQEEHVLDGNLSASRGDFSPSTLEIQLRSSEQDPSPHQVTIPSAHEMLFPARLCEALMQYRAIDQNFDYGSLVGMPRAQMCNFLLMIESSSPSRNKASADSLKPSSPVGKQSSSPKGASATQHLMEIHVPIIKFLANADDLVLEGFFHEICDHTKRKSFDTTSDMSTRDRMEVAIFKSDARRQFFVIYQGCSDTQEKPVKKGEHKDGIERRFTIGRKDDDHRFSEEQPVVVFPPFRKAYFNSDIEKQVFTTLDSLAEQHPFFDVIISGHSFGGVMALLSSMRYANIRPAIMVSCYAFGCPKIGNIDFRYYVNSLPNLRVYRVEYGCDPWTNVPDHPTWSHAGHTITICKHLDSSVGSSNTDDQGELLVKAYKFGEHRPEYAGKESKLGKILSRQANKDKQMDHDVSTYVVSLEQIIGYGKGPRGLWPTEFVGEDGTGVQGLDKEKRLVC